MRIFLLPLLFALLTGTATAQSEAFTEVMSQGMQPGLSMAMDGLSPKACEKYWREYVATQGSKPQRDRKTKEWVASSVRVDGQSMRLYSKVEGKGDRSAIMAWFAVDDTFVDDMNLSESYPAAQRFMDSFAHYVAVEEMQAEVEDKEKELKKLENAMSKLERDRAHYEQEIKKAQDRIKTMEENIVKNTSAQEAMQQEVKAQQEVVEVAKSDLQDLRKQQ